MLVGTLFLMLGVIWQTYLVPCLLIGITLISFGEGISFSVIYRFALMSSDVSKRNDRGCGFNIDDGEFLLNY